MKLLLFCAGILSLALPAAAQRDLLKADLLSPDREAAGAQAAGHITALAEKTHEPPPADVLLFSIDLVRAIRPSPAVDRPVGGIVTEIDYVMKSAGTSTIAFREHVANFERLMISAGASRPAARKMALQLENMGKHVRGPEDTPVR